MDESRALPALRTFSELLAFAILGLVAALTTFHGLSMLIAAVPLLGYASEDARIEAASNAALLLGAAFVASGAVARHFARSRQPLLPNEREMRAERPPLGSWGLVMASGLLLLPLATFYELAPLASLWTDMIKVLKENHVLDNALSSPQMSGVVLAPVIGAVTVPLVQLITAAAFAGSSLVLSLLLWSRPFRFPRAYVICVVLQAGLVFASVYGAELATGVAAWVADQAGRSATQVRTIEVVRILEAVERYNSVLRSTSHSLAWTFVGYALWLAPLLASRRAREMFALSVGDFAPSEETPPLSAVGELEPDARRRFYEEAARTLQAPSASAGVYQGNMFAVLIVSTLVGALFMLFALLRAFSASGVLRSAG